MSTSNCQYHSHEEESIIGVNKKAPLYVSVLFFLSAAGSTISWTSVLSNLVFYTDVLGADSYIYLNLCCQGVLLPVILCQTYFDDLLDRHLFSSSQRGFQTRAGLSYALMLLSTIYVPFASQNASLIAVTFSTLLMGITSAVLHGALKQLAALVYPGCARLPAAVTAGLQASAVAVLILSYLCPLSPQEDSTNNLYIFYGVVALLLLLCWGCFHFLMSYCPDVQLCMKRRDRTLKALIPDAITIDQDPEAALQQPLLPTDTDNDNCFNTEPLSISTFQILQQSWPLFLALFLNVSVSRAIMSWFNRVPSTTGNKSLPQVLFYTRLFADLMARPATLCLNTSNPEADEEDDDAPSSALSSTDSDTTDSDNDDDDDEESNTNSTQPNSDDDDDDDDDNTDTTTSTTSKSPITNLMVVVLTRLFFVPYFFLYTMPQQFPWIPRNDIVIIAGVLFFCFTSGFVITWVYQLGPQILLQSHTNSTSQERDAARLHQANLLNACLGASMLIGVLSSLAISWLLSSS